MLKPSYINGLSILGGEPMEPRNQSGVFDLVKRVHEELPDKDIWCYSGFTFEQLMTPGEYPNTELTRFLLGLIYMSIFAIDNINILTSCCCI